MDVDLLLMLFYSCMIGAGIGTFSGLVPGIHVNTLAVILMASSGFLLDLISSFAPDSYGPLMLASCVVSAAVVHSAVDFVPSAFFGVPDADNVLNVLPAHRLLLQGDGMVAVRCAAIGSLVGSAMSLILAVPVYYLLSTGFGEYLNALTVGVLLLVLSLMIIDEEPDKRKIAVAVMVLSGIMGVITMSVELPMESMIGLQPETMFPLLTGLFGIPSLLMAQNGSDIPTQYDDEPFPVSPLPGIKGVLTGSITGWFPGITSTAGATIAGHVFGGEDTRGFISMISSIGTASTMFTFVTLCVSGNERSGTMSVVNGFLEGWNLAPGSDAFLSMMFTMAVAAVLAYVIMIKSGKIMCTIAERIDTKKISTGILVLMVLMTVLFCGYWGILLLLICSVIGMIPILYDTNRIHLTGCLVIPVILFKSGIL